MATLTLFEVPEKLVQVLRERAQASGRSLEEEALAILHDEAGVPMVDAETRLGGERAKRLGAMREMEESWKWQDRPTTAEEVDAWIRQTRR